MEKKTLTLKSVSRNSKPAILAVQATPTCIVAGRTTKGKAPQGCQAVIKRLSELIQAHRKVFIQMRHGAGYCGVPTQLDDGWLTMTEVSIHGTKQTASSPSILIQVRDGTFIAHLHAIESHHTTGVQK